MRDITLEDTCYFRFTTRAFGTGVPTQLAGTPALSVLEQNNATPITSGVSVSVDRASVTGLNEATVVATAANGYEAGKSYAVYISTGTVGGVSVVGEVVAEFTVQSAAAFTRLGAPAGASVSADVAAIKAETATILSDTNDIQTRLPAALVSGRMDSSVGAMAANVITAAATAADYLAEINAEADAALADVGLTTTITGRIDVATSTRLASASYTTPPTSAANADAVWDEILSGHVISGSAGEALAASGGAGDPWITALPGSYTAGQAGYIVGTFIDAAVSTRLASAGYTAPLSAAGTRTALGLASANLDTQLDALPTATENADALLNRDMSAVSDTNARSPLNALRHIRNKWSLSGTTLTVTKEDDSTTAWTATMTTNASADPITGSDPA